jgi:hypothetical protein
MYLPYCDIDISHKCIVAVNYNTHHVHFETVHSGCSSVLRVDLPMPDYMIEIFARLDSICCPDGERIY